MAAKLGIVAPDRALAEDALKLMQSQTVDFTRFFRALSVGTARTLFTEPEPFDAWAARREVLLPADRAAVAAAMDRVNPVYIPRNHRVEEALAAATEGEMAPFHRLADVVSRPFEEQPGCEDYAGPAPVSCAPYVTYCGT
jgi:serine/tyrosine/threonine adenylyltransferase